MACRYLVPYTHGTAEGRRSIFMTRTVDLRPVPTSTIRGSAESRIVFLHSSLQSTAVLQLAPSVDDPVRDVTLSIKFIFAVPHAPGVVLSTISFSRQRRSVRCMGDSPPQLTAAIGAAIANVPHAHEPSLLRCYSWLGLGLRGGV